MQVRQVGPSSYLIGEDITVGADVQVGANTTIRATTCVLEDGVRIGADTTMLVADALHIGSHTRLGDRNVITGRTIRIGAHCYWEHDIEVGQGGRFGPDAHLEVGPFGMVCDRVLLNLNHAIRIGASVGIGNEVNIWTHGSFLPVLRGYPADFGPVTIGDEVWLPARSVVLPNCTIGSHVVIGIGSLVNRDIPDGAFAAGWPIRIRATGRYPQVAWTQNTDIVRSIVAAYEPLRIFKHLDLAVQYDAATQTITAGQAVFNLATMEVAGTLTEAEEDFRDYLRRRGIKFFTDAPFRSVLPPAYQRLLAIDPNASHES